MKNFAIFLIVGALLMTQGAKWLTKIQTGFRQQQIDVSVQRANEAKATFAQANADNDAALEAYNAGTADERAQTLLDLGLLSDENVLCLVDPGALDERPTAHSPAELDAIAHGARVQSGSLLAMR